MLIALLTCVAVGMVAGFLLIGAYIALSIEAATRSVEETKD